MPPVVLVTGAARRIGAEIALTLHSSGYDVALHYRNSGEAAQQLATSLETVRPGSTLLLQSDLLDITALPALVNSIQLRFGRLDALVNNASSFYPTPLGQITEHDWDNLIGANAKAPIFLAQAAANALRAARGAIVNIVDIHADRPMRGHLVYNISKAALVAATRSLARELGPTIRVNAIAPGANIWPEGESALDTETRQRIVDHTILKRTGEPRDIAETVRFLLQEAAYITGQIIAVDGGRSIVMAD